MGPRGEPGEIEVDISRGKPDGKMQYFANFMDCSVISQEYILWVFFGAEAKKNCLFSTASI